MEFPWGDPAFLAANHRWLVFVLLNLLPGSPPCRAEIRVQVGKTLPDPLRGSQGEGELAGRILWVTTGIMSSHWREES